MIHFQAQNNARNNQKWAIRVRKNNDDLNIQKKRKGARNPIPSAPNCLEEVPLRRMDKKTLNAMRRRRADQRIAICLAFTALVFILLGIIAVLLWFMYRLIINDYE